MRMVKGNVEEKFHLKSYGTKLLKCICGDLREEKASMCFTSEKKRVEYKGKGIEKTSCQKIWSTFKHHIKKKSCLENQSFILFKKVEEYNLGDIFPITGVEMEELEYSMKENRWAYRAEGNANLVIALIKENVVLRFYKWDGEKGWNKYVIDQGEEKVKRDIKFCNFIMHNFLGKAYVQPPLLAHIPDEIVEQIHCQILHQRPVHRRHKRIHFGWVTISPDYAFLPPVLSFHQNLSINGFEKHLSKPTYCVEIKPKQGWINLWDRCHPKCTFCINQFLKVERKSISRISHYCPLDLFSGNKNRMERAVKGLLETPQNNLKIFKDGNLVYSDDLGNYLEVLQNWLEPNPVHGKSENIRLVNKWCRLIQEALNRELTEEALPSSHKCGDVWSNGTSTDYTDSPLSHLFHNRCDWSSSPLRKESILNRILSLQKLQQSSFSAVYDQYMLLQGKESDFTYLTRLSKSKQLTLIERYLLSATANDCSILITFQRTEKNIYEIDPVHYIKDFDGSAYLMNIGVSDLDPKPLSCIDKHYKRNKDMVAACFKFLGKHSNSSNSNSSSFENSCCL